MKATALLPGRAHRWWAEWRNRLPARRAEAAGPLPAAAALPLARFADALQAVCWTYEPRRARFMYVSAAYERVWGRSPVRLYADAGEWTADVHEADRPLLQHALAQLAVGVGYTIEYRLATPEGGLRWVAEEASPVAGAVPPLVAGVSRDISEQRDAMLALQQADRRKDEGLAVLAHELRTPLQSLRTAAAMLAGTQGRPAAIIERQVVHLARLVDDLGDATRVRHGKLRLQRERVRLRDVVQDAIDDQAALFAAGGLQVRLAAPAHEVWVLADALRLAQVFGNLLHNAAKFSAAGATVDVAIEHRAGERSVAVSVRDAGAGIDGALIGSVFELFAQGEPAPAGRARGLGIGLSVVRGIVELHGGQVSVHSGGRGCGCRFVVTLDTVPAPPAGRARRVLVVEDNTEAGRSLQAWLESEGHAVALAASGYAALAQAAHWQPDAVVLDIGLPDIDGCDVARHLRTQSPEPGPTLIALTGAGRETDLRAMRAAGFDHCLAKPADLAALTALLSP